MGRTKRRRLSKLKPLRSLQNEPNIVNLMQFMARHGFINHNKLKLTDFPQTGRGVTSLRNVKEQDVLITLPFKLLISYVTLISTNFFEIFTAGSKLKTHDLLSVFLIFERHKPNSFWKDYLNSLPTEPPWLPAFLQQRHIELLPSDLRLEIVKSRKLLDESWSRIRKSMKADFVCGCCGRNMDCVLNKDSFSWAYVLVNTRAVYVDPQIILENSGRVDVLSDEPSMVLCPFLDMFNHSSKAGSKAQLLKIDGNLHFQLCSLTNYQKYEQIFISYGCHDNIKLLVEYGFFLSDNENDVITFGSDEIFKNFNVNLDTFRYKFIKNHKLDSGLYISKNGPSFNLKGFIYVVFADDAKRTFNTVIYTDNYPESFKTLLKNLCLELLFFKISHLQALLVTLKKENTHNVVIDFIKHRLYLSGCVQEELNKHIF